MILNTVYIIPGAHDISVIHFFSFVSDNIIPMRFPREIVIINGIHMGISFLVSVPVPISLFSRGHYAGWYCGLEIFFTRARVFRSRVSAVCLLDSKMHNSERSDKIKGGGRIVKYEMVKSKLFNRNCHDSGEVVVTVK